MRQAEAEQHTQEAEDRAEAVLLTKKVATATSYIVSFSHYFEPLIIALSLLMPAS